MRVQKRDGTYEDISFDKVLHRIRKLCNGLNNVSADIIAQQVCGRIYDGVKTSELDELAAQLCASKITEHPDYGVLASRIVVSNHQKKTSPSFSETMTILYNAKDVNGNNNPLISDEVYKIVMTHKEKLNQVIDYDRDFDVTYFGHKTLERSYLTKVNGKIVERAQHLWMRVALGIHGWDLKEAIDTYNYMSQRKFTHATPTLFNSGTRTPANASCFLLGLDDSISGIYKNIGDCAQISKTAGGIGIHVHNIRAKNSYIRGTNGTSTGIIPMLRVYNETAKYVNQCFTPETLVYTLSGVVPIEELNPGDRVLTHDNSYKPVTELHKNYVNKEIYKITTDWSSAPVCVTGEHVVYTLNSHDTIAEVTVDTLTTDMYLGYPPDILNVIKPVKKEYGLNWVHIKSIEKVYYSGYVYDLTVYVNHNYVTDIGLVHNSGRRNGSIAVYLEPWHADIQSFIELRKNSGNEEERTRDLFTALWIPDLFMKRVQENGDWYLMCPDECPGLPAVYGEEFEKLYQSYVDSGKYRKVIKAQELWMAILKSQIETGTPYMGYKDNVNRKNNQINLGTIKSSNLCVAPETMILTQDGYFPIKELCENTVKVWNGHEFSEVVVKQTGTNQKLITVEFSNGMEVRCTPYHKFYINSDGNSIIVDAQNLKPDMKIINYELPNVKDYLNVNINKEYIKITHLTKKQGQQSLLQMQLCGIKTKLIKNNDTYTILISDGSEQLTVSKIEDNNEYDDTYCFTEPLRHAGIFNGVIMGQCIEINEYSDDKQYASCNLASISLPAFVKTHENGEVYYDFEELHMITQVVIRNLNKVIDTSYYSMDEIKKPNLQTRPLGLGVQGLADVFFMMKYPFESKEAAELNRQIAETMYHAALTSSMLISKKRHELLDEYENTETSMDRKQQIEKYLMLTDEEKELKEYRGAYAKFVDSPAYHGKLQFDLWGSTPSDKYDWNLLKSEIAKYGIRNSLLIAYMPTASSSQILGNYESFEPVTSNVFVRDTLAGNFIIPNKYLITDLIRLGLWNNDMKDKLIAENGSVQNIPEIPDDIKQLYKTVYEIKQKAIMDMSAARGAYVCQSQSLNIYLPDTDMNRLSNIHFYGWKVGLKTGSYYTRVLQSVRMTNYAAEVKKNKPTEEEIAVCRRDNKEACMMCSS